MNGRAGGLGGGLRAEGGQLSQLRVSLARGITDKPLKPTQRVSVCVCVWLCEICASFLWLNPIQPSNKNC